VHGSFHGWTRGWQESVGRAVVHYRRSGWSPSGCLHELAAALCYGPTPVDDAIARCEALLGEATERVAEAGVEAFLGGLHGLAGRFDEARGLAGKAQTTMGELGEHYISANTAGRMLARIELLAEEHTAAEHVLRDCCAEFERAGDGAALATAAAQLAGALYAQERFEEAGAWAERAREHSPRDDVAAQFAWRSAQAKLRARAGDLAAGERLALEAVAIAETTDALSDHGRVLLDLAVVLGLGNRPTDGAKRVEEALALFARKGDVASADAGRALLAVLAPV
jgi:tetratricopeptide (TPR) repeat protein